MYPPILSPPLCLVPFTLPLNYHFTPSLSLSLLNSLISLLIQKASSTHLSLSLSDFDFFKQSLEISIDPHEVPPLLWYFLNPNHNVCYLQTYPSSSSCSLCFHHFTSLILSSTCPTSEFSSSNQHIFQLKFPKSNHVSHFVVI